MDFVIVATFNTYFDAIPYKSKLESEGITCYLKDEHLVTTASYYNVAVGGIKLCVPEDRYYDAREILSYSGLELEKEDKPPEDLTYKLDIYTQTLPFIGKLTLPLRLFIILAPLILLAILTALNMNGFFNE